MGKQPNAVKTPAQRVSRLEARREQLLVVIERARRRFEKHDKGQRRALKDLANYERESRRLDKRIAQAKSETADELVMSAAPPPKPKVEDVTEITELTSAGGFGIDLDDGVPQFLKDAAAERARKLNALPDPKTKEKKAERRAVEKEKREAELRGKRRKFPLTGRAALDQIAKRD
jgi:hypothetical protein